MHFTRILASLAAVFLLQGCYAHVAFLDTDDNPNTGCTVDFDELDLSENLNGIEKVVLVAAMNSDNIGNNAKAISSEFGSAVTTADAIGNNQAVVVGTVVATCDPGENEFDEDFIGPYSWPVGLNNGGNGADVIEFAVPRSQLGNSTRMRVVFASSRIDDPGAVAQALKTKPTSLLKIPHHTDITQSFVITLSQARSAPALSIGALSVLGFLLFWLARRRLDGQAPWLTSMILALSLAGAAYAATITLDGDVNDWVGVEALGTDPNDDSTAKDPGEEITQVFATSDQSNVYFRIDVVDTEAGLITPP